MIRNIDNKWIVKFWMFMFVEVNKLEVILVYMI